VLLFLLVFVELSFLGILYTVSAARDCAFLLRRCHDDDEADMMLALFLFCGLLFALLSCPFRVAGPHVLEKASLSLSK
jgi:hypothetical protein